MSIIKSIVKKIYPTKSDAWVGGYLEAWAWGLGTVGLWVLAMVVGIGIGLLYLR